MSEKYIKGAIVALSIIAATYLMANGIDGWIMMVLIAILAL